MSVRTIVGIVFFTAVLNATVYSFVLHGTDESRKANEVLAAKFEETFKVADENDKKMVAAAAEVVQLAEQLTGIADDTEDDQPTERNGEQVDDVTEPSGCAFTFPLSNTRFRFGRCGFHVNTDRVRVTLRSPQADEADLPRQFRVKVETDAGVKESYLTLTAAWPPQKLAANLPVLPGSTVVKGINIAPVEAFSKTTRILVTVGELDEP